MMCTNFWYSLLNEPLGVMLHFHVCEIHKALSMGTLRRWCAMRSEINHPQKRNHFPKEESHPSNQESHPYKISAWPWKVDVRLTAIWNRAWNNFKVAPSYFIRQFQPSKFSGGEVAPLFLKPLNDQLFLPVYPMSDECTSLIIFWLSFDDGMISWDQSWSLFRVWI